MNQNQHYICQKIIKMSTPTTNSGFGSSKPPVSETVKPQNSSSNNKTWIIVLAALLGITTISTGLLYKSKLNLEEQLLTCGSDLNKEELEKKNALAELNAMLRQYDELSQQNNSLSAELQGEKEKIQKLIEQAKNKDFTIGKLRKETETLREIMKGYIHTIDSLNVLNQNLTTENIAVKGELTTQKEISTNLEAERQTLSEKVKVGSLLDAINVTAGGYNRKGSGTLKETERAGRTEAIKCCFDIARNNIAKAGTRKIYMRIISPFGVVLGEKSEEGFSVNGHSSVYTLAKEVDYQNAQTNVCMIWDVTNPITKGDYIVQLYCDGVELGSTKFALK